MEEKKIPIVLLISNSFYWFKDERFRSFFIAYFLVFLFLFCVGLAIASAVLLFLRPVYSLISFVFLVVWTVVAFFAFIVIKKGREAVDFFKEYLKYFLIYAILPVVIAAVIAAVLLISNWSQVLTLLIYSSSPADFLSSLSSLPAAIILIIAFIIFAISSSYLSTFYTISKIGKIFGKKSVFEKFSMASMIEAVKFWIVSFFAPLFNWIDKRIFAIQITLIILAILSLLAWILIPSLVPDDIAHIISIIFPILLIVLFFIYLAICLYNAIRFFPALILRIFKSKKATEALTECWEMTKGNALPIFASLIVIAIAAWIISVILQQLPTSIFSFIASLIFPESVRLIEYMLLPLSILSNAIAVFISIFFMFSIYSQLSKNFVFKK